MNSSGSAACVEAGYERVPNPPLVPRGNTMPTLASFRTFVFRSASTVPSWQRSVSAVHMPELFSPRARMVSFLAHEHAFRLHANGVGGDHLLLALPDDRRCL